MNSALDSSFAIGRLAVFAFSAINSERVLEVPENAVYSLVISQ
jgi:hypothetical protein